MATVNRPKYEYKLGESRSRNQKAPTFPQYNPGFDMLANYPPLYGYQPMFQFMSQYGPQQTQQPTFLPLISYQPSVASTSTPPSSPTPKQQTSGQTAPARTDQGAESSNVPSFNPYRDPYAFTQVPFWDPEFGGYRYTLTPGNDPRGAQEGLMPTDYAGRNWSSSYAPEYYKNLYRNSPTWLAGSSRGRTIMGRGRIPGRFNPDDKDKNEDETTGSSVPAWVGPLVSWRT